MWLLILVMVGTDNPDIMTIPVETYETKEICQAELETLTEEAQDTSGQAALVCLRDGRMKLPDLNDIELKPFDDGMQYPADDSLIIVKAMDMKLEPGIIMSGV